MFFTLNFFYKRKTVNFADDFFDFLWISNFNQFNELIEIIFFRFSYFFISIFYFHNILNFIFLDRNININFLSKVCQREEKSY